MCNTIMHDRQVQEAPDVGCGQAKTAQEPANLHLIVVGPVPPPSGGMAGQTEQIVRLWRREGLRAELIPVNPPYRPVWIEHVRILRSLFRLVPYAARLWRSLGRADVAHVMANSGWSWFLYAVPAIIAGRLRGVPVIVNYRGGQAGVFLDRYGPVAKPFMRLANAMVVPSAFLAEVFAQHGVETVVVPNIVDLERFQWRAQSGSAISQPHILVARNLERIYDIGTAIQAFAQVRRQLPNAVMTVAGSGPEQASLQELAAGLGLTHAIRFTGRVDAAQMAALYANANVMLNTSVVDNMPNSILEALASGVPVVTSHVGGIPYMVRDGDTALLVPPRDPRATAEAISRILLDHSLATALARRGRDEVQQYCWRSVKCRWLDVYRQELASRA